MLTHLYNFLFPHCSAALCYIQFTIYGLPFTYVNFFVLLLVNPKTSFVQFQAFIPLSNHCYAYSCVSTAKLVP